MIKIITFIFVFGNICFIKTFMKYTVYFDLWLVISNRCLLMCWCLAFCPSGVITMWSCVGWSVAGPGSLQGYYVSYKEGRGDFLGWSRLQSRQRLIHWLLLASRAVAEAGAGDDVELSWTRREDEGSYTQLRTLRHHGDIRGCEALERCLSILVDNRWYQILNIWLWKV